MMLTGKIIYKWWIIAGKIIHIIYPIILMKNQVMVGIPPIHESFREYVIIGSALYK